MVKSTSVTRLNTLKRYRPNLSALMQLCETNYALLMQLLLNSSQKNVELDKQYSFFISDKLQYCLTVKEVTPYTTLLNFKQCITDTNYGEILAPTMMIRLYHDARMAEINASQHIRYIKPRYNYPNHKMHYPDEKQQINQFLKEWLQLCLQQGQVEVSLATFTKSLKRNDQQNEN